MNLAHEIEIKLLVSGEGLAQLLGHPLFSNEPEVHHLTTLYYDLPDWRLSSGRMALRLRQVDGRIEQSLKIGTNNSRPMERAEWNCDLATEQLDIDLFPAAPRKILHKAMNGETPRPFARVEVERRTWLIHHGSSTIEMALDTGIIEAGAGNEPVAELELELKRGQLGDLLDIAQTLPLGPGLAWSSSSKGERAYLLARGFEPQASRSSPVPLDASLSVAGTFQQIAWQCLDHLLRNYRLVIDHADEEALHQSRVALRRFRAACSIFADMLNDPRSMMIRATIAAATRALSPARDLDVLIRLSRSFLDDGANPVEADPLSVQLGQQRAAAYAKARDMLVSASFQCLLFQVAEWIDHGDWLTNAPRTMSSIDYAADALRSLRKKVKKRGRHFDRMDSDARHRLRIRIKKLRYATDFFAPIFPDEEQVLRHKSFSRALGELQDHLGDLNDLAMSRHLDISSLDCLNEIEQARLTAGLEQALSDKGTEEQRLIEASAAALQYAMKTPPFWTNGQSDR